MPRLRRSSRLAGRRNVPDYRDDVLLSAADFRHRFWDRYPYIYSRTGGVYNYSDADTSGTTSVEDKDKEPRLAKPDPKEVLTVQYVDFHVSANCKAHRTDEYDIASPSKDSPKLVVRRGQPFNIDVDFSKPYDPAKDDLRIVFQAGDKPLPSKGTHVEFILSDEDKPNEWGAKILKRVGNTLTVCIFTPPTCYVGKWNLKLDVVKKSDTALNVFRYSHTDPIYIIFNPWCKDDAVYMGDEEKLLKEYVLNETGKIYSGSKRNPTHKPWNFGQFESCVLDVALYLLDVSELNWAVRGNPIPVTRKLSALINSSDDDGVLTGNWSGNYSGGRSPLSWIGSVAILEEYWRTKKPVKFGQCWVFSGVTTTLCRALGIPARSVTNFASAHDTDGSITIDIHYDTLGESDDSLNYDSVWNFHVWNEAWMARPDLPFGYGGWQAIDSTPQETSDNVYCCGPVSVNAIRDGEVNLPYDAPFVFAEVNADRCHWMPDFSGKLQCVQIDKNAVGKKISTKRAGSGMREDVTANYKHPEGSAGERAAVLKANQLGSTKPEAYSVAVKDVEFTVDQDSENTWIGEAFKLSLTMKNCSKQKRTVSGRIVVKTMFYTGVVADRVCTVPFEKLAIPKGENHVVQVVVEPKDYVDKLKDCCMLDVSVWAKVDETMQCFTAKEDYRLRKPHLKIKAPTECVQGSEINAEVSFVNPLDIMLTECVVSVDGLAREFRFPQGNINPKGTFHATLPLTPEKIGYKEIIVLFSSAQLEDINTSHNIFIRSSN